ncbi:MAG TPA: hypothetical protein VJH91_02380 [Candidatus Paceibacterota bacterium]
MFILVLEEGEMPYGKSERQAIKRLAPDDLRRFEILEKCELGEIVAVAELCRALRAGPTLLAYACLAGDGVARMLEESLGFLSSDRKTRRVQQVLTDLRDLGCATRLVVIVDDFEPCRAWQWDVPQEQITEWCRLLVDATPREVFAGSDVEFVLCSELEQGFEPRYEEIYPKICDPKFEILVHKNLQHIRRFPNKKRVGDGRESTVRKVAQYAIQGLVLEHKFPHGILLQTETPWAVKDPLYDSLRQRPLPIAHLFPDERR